MDVTTNPHLTPRLSMRRATLIIPLCASIGTLRGDLYLYLRSADVSITVSSAFQGSTLNLFGITDRILDASLCFYMRNMACVKGRRIVDVCTDM
jgi:hypothetical protein